MNRRLVAFMVFVAMSGGGTFLALRSADAQTTGRQLYTACNIWYERPTKIYSTLYQKGAMIPAGTPVANVIRKRKYVVFTDAKTSTTYRIYWIRKHRPGISFAQFCQRLLTPKPFKQLTKGFTKQEIDAIKTGSVVNGMSKAAVLVSWGYPPEIRTPSIVASSWTYWKSRFDTVIVSFANDRVGSIID